MLPGNDLQNIESSQEPFCLFALHHNKNTSHVMVLLQPGSQKENRQIRMKLAQSLAYFPESRYHASLLDYWVLTPCLPTSSRYCLSGIFGQTSEPRYATICTQWAAMFHHLQISPLKYQYCQYQHWAIVSLYSIPTTSEVLDCCTSRGL